MFHHPKVPPETVQAIERRLPEALRGIAKCGWKLSDSCVLVYPTGEIVNSLRRDAIRDAVAKGRKDIGEAIFRAERSNALLVVLVAEDGYMTIYADGPATTAANLPN